VSSQNKNLEQLLICIRDACQSITVGIDEYVNAKNLPETPTPKPQQQSTRQNQLTVSEFDFSLQFDEHISERMGKYSTASKENNGDQFQRAFSILHLADAKINKRYVGKGYKHSYWLWKDNIYRQQLKGASQ